MRAGAPRGDVQAQGAAVTATTSLAEVIGATIDVPPGHIAICTWWLLLAPSGNTLTGAAMIDGVQQPNATATSVTLRTGGSFKVPPGSHRVGVGGFGSTATGQLAGAQLSYVIALKDGR